ncbi:cellulose biosynthesis protein BcsP [Paraburkholderia saeva]|uniref:cellulose biosynthesis protein BcsP n=1 Tax=Paraburkholderia saeva TaxID=2777537 RepID=UPI001E15D6C8|nr:cellulose biosynthesis protein BcsP [Paraburkholderia saeva]CAG4888932.1 hypothetical protein R70241_00606 [Paraburkholderia saeva]
MTLSRDIQTLFDHFGGNAEDYQEIGRENEARTARTRWPLLVTLDLTQPEIPAVAQRRERAHTGNLSSTDGEPGDAASTAVPRSRPLFARAHRRNIPPVANVALPVAPTGAPRFSAAPDATPEEQAPPGAAGMASAASAPATLPTHAPTPSSAAIPPAQARARLATPGASAHAASSFGSFTPTAPAAARPMMPAAAAAPSILGRLFQPAAPQARPQPASHAPYAPPVPAAPLQSMFDRLRGTPSHAVFGTAAAPAAAERNAPRSPASPSAPASNAWLTRGPRRP